MPIGHFNDLVACYLIEHGAKQKNRIKSDGIQSPIDELFPDLD